MNPNIEVKGFSVYRNRQDCTEVGFSRYRRIDDEAFLKPHRKGHDMTEPLAPGAGDMESPVKGKRRTEGL
jgi:hypothetical protein